MTDFFTSDYHFAHKNIVKWSERPYADADAMGEALVDEWNAVVKPNDRVFVLGDFSFADADKTSAILKCLVGQKFLVQGNHDSNSALKKTVGWCNVRHYIDMRIGEDRIVLSHFPILSWHQMHRGAYHLHGHCHGNLKLPPALENARMMDVGIDATVKWTGKYRPVAWEEIVEKLKDKDAGSTTDGHKIKTNI
jgi:calcineurin-like phosphoesterase family protein